VRECSESPGRIDGGTLAVANPDDATTLTKIRDLIVAEIMAIRRRVSNARPSEIRMSAKGDRSDGLSYALLGRRQGGHVPNDGRGRQPDVSTQRAQRHHRDAR
jgi:hypothetical protein